MFLIERFALPNLNICNMEIRVLRPVKEHDGLGFSATLLSSFFRRESNRRLVFYCSSASLILSVNGVNGEGIKKK